MSNLLRQVFQNSVIIFSVLIVTNMYATNSPKSVQFFNGNYEQAKEKAAMEGKFFMMDFYADWCMPCKWMDQTTFTNDEVASIVNKKYVAFKVNIDDIEGFDLKKKYEIQYLPTILIFNHKGELVDRIEETLPPSKLIAALGKHNVANSSTQEVYTYNTSPTQSKKLISNNDEVSEDYQLDRKTLSNYKEANKNRSFRIQIGIYEEHENAFDVVNNLRDKFIEPIIVLNDYKNDNVIYKVMMGEFKTMGEAESFKSILKNDFDIDAIVQ